MQTGKLTQARLDFENALKQDDNFAPAHYNLALTLRKIGDETQAQTEFATAHRLDSNLSQ